MLVHSAGQVITIAAPLAGSIVAGVNQRRAAVGGGFGGSITDRGTVTSMAGYLRRRVDCSDNGYDPLRGVRP